MDEIYARLLSGLNSGLPGHDAFLEMSGYKRLDIEKARQLVPPPRESAVLALISSALQNSAYHADGAPGV
ncbi:MAG: hypothetical protein IPO10_08970 [Flavobacteriales bacterium]|nr:hypothetical protein [Flavobacteriales bacterium]